MLLPTLLLAMALSTQGFDDGEFDQAFRKDGEGLREYAARVGELMRRLGEPRDHSQVSVVPTGR